MKRYSKQDFPLHQIRQHLETGPVVLVASAWKGETNIMTMSWPTVMEFTPALVGCIISSANHSFALIRKSKECTINIPTVELAKTVAGVGNCSGGAIDKFEKFRLTQEPADMIGAPLIAECYASFECRLADGRMIERYNFFIWEVVKAHVATSPQNPKTIHYRGNGAFMVAGPTISLRRKFRPEYL